MSSSRAPSAPLAVLIVCAPDDTPAVRAVAQRLRADGLSPTLASELIGAPDGSPHALREALRQAGAVVVCLSRRASTSGELAPVIANLLDLLPLTPAPRRLLFALRLTGCELPPALRDATAFDLFSASGYQRLLAALRDHAEVLAPPAPPPTPAPQPAPPAPPALTLTGGFGLPSLDRQGLVRRLGRGVARAVFLVDAQSALLVSGGGPALVDLGGGPPRWAIDCPTHCAALSPSGRLLALAAGEQIALWDLEDGRLRGVCVGHSDTVSGLAFAPDERSFASASHDRSVRLWRTGDEATPPALLATLLDHGDQATCVAFSPDGALIAAGGADRSVRLWRSFDRSRVQTLPGHSGAVEVIAFSPDGATLAAGSRGHVVRLWDARAWVPLHTLEGHSGAVESLAFSPDGATLATGSSDHSARIWQTHDGAMLQLLTGHSGPVVAVAFSPDGATLATLGADERLLAWHVASGAQSAALRPLSGRVTSLAIGPDGAQLAVGGSDGTLAVYGLDAEAPPRMRYTDHQGAISSLAFAGPGRLVSVSHDRSVRAYRLDTGTSDVLLQAHGALHGGTLAHDGRLLASSDGASTVQLWRLPGPHETGAGQFWRVLRGLRGRPRLITFGPRGEQIAVATENGAISLWRLAELKDDQAPPAVTLSLSGGGARCVAFSANEQLLAAGGDTGSVELWHSDTGALAGRVGGQGRAVTGLAFAPDARAIAVGDARGGIRIWRLSLGDGRRRNAAPTTIAGHAGAVNQLAFAPGGATLVSGSSDGTVRLWRV